MVILPSAKYVIEWMEMAVSTMKKVRSVGSKDVQELEYARKTMQKSAHLRLLRAFQQNPKSFTKKKGENVSQVFAVQFEPRRLLMEEECRKLWKNQRMS